MFAGPRFFAGHIAATLASTIPPRLLTVERERSLSCSPLSACARHFLGDTPNSDMNQRVKELSAE